jgi:hypothetical protein
MSALSLRCPECQAPQALACQAGGTYDHFTLTLISQTCECDPFGAWEELWEQARDIIFEDGSVD